MSGSGATRNPRSRRWVATGVAAVVIVLVVFVVAQGNDGGSSPLNAIAKAADVTQRVAGGRAVIHATVTVSNTPEGLTESGIDGFRRHRAARGGRLPSAATRRVAKRRCG